jgi:hypothetical protein
VQSLIHNKATLQEANESEKDYTRKTELCNDHDVSENACKIGVTEFCKRHWACGASGERRAHLSRRSSCLQGTGRRTRRLRGARAASGRCYCKSTLRGLQPMLLPIENYSYDRTRPLPVPLLCILSTLHHEDTCLNTSYSVRNTALSDAWYGRYQSVI